MNVEKQKLLISYLMSNNDLFARCNAIIDTGYFDAEVKHAVHFITEHFEKYRAAPTPDQVKAETGQTYTTKELSKQEIEYASTEVETFCKNKAIEKAILAAPQLLQKGDFGKLEKNIKDAIAVGLNKNLGLNYFEDPEERLRRMLLNNVMIPTGWHELDILLNGGVSRKEMTMFMANSGVGKSILMSNIAVNFLAQKLNVLYISLELSEEVVAKRFDSMMTGVGQADIFSQLNKVTSEVTKKSGQMGQLFIKRMPESLTNANHIRAYLKEFELVNGFVPDVLVVDYLDLLTTNQKISQENLFVKDKYVAEEVRSIANDYNLVVITASQMGRTAIEAEDHNQSHIQGGISKINTTDNLIAIIQSEAMKAAGEYLLKLIKTRSSGGVGQHLVLGWDPISLRVSNLNEIKKNKILLNKNNFKKEEDEAPSANEKNGTKRDILSLMRV